MIRSTYLTCERTQAYALVSLSVTSPSLPPATRSSRSAPFSFSGNIWKPLGCTVSLRGRPASFFRAVFYESAKFKTSDVAIATTHHFLLRGPLCIDRLTMNFRPLCILLAWFPPLFTHHTIIGKQAYRRSYRPRVMLSTYPRRNWAKCSLNNVGLT